MESTSYVLSFRMVFSYLVTTGWFDISVCESSINQSNHGDNPLLRPTGIQIATKSSATLQAMAPTNVETVHQTSLLYIESNLDRLGLLSPTHGQRSQQQSGQITLQSVLINKSKFFKVRHRTEIRKIEIPSSRVGMLQFIFRPSAMGTPKHKNGTHFFSFLCYEFLHFFFCMCPAIGFAQK